MGESLGTYVWRFDCTQNLSGLAGGCGVRIRAGERHRCVMHASDDTASFWCGVPVVRPVSKRIKELSELTQSTEILMDCIMPQSYIHAIVIR
eukprot:scaffold59441_cov17-Prasinocladus_malaysianus.AAC.1